MTGTTLNDAEYFAGEISKQVGQLLNERDNLRRELSRRMDGSLEHDKAFVRCFQENVISASASDGRIARLEKILLMKG